MSALQTAVIGRPTIINEELIDKILKHLSVGNYVKPSVEASGLAYSTFRLWMQQGEADKAAGKQSLFSTLTDRVAHAQAAAEAAIVAQLHGAEDWRAQSFLLERRHRDRWGKDEQPRAAAVTIVIPDSLAAVLGDALAVASRRSTAVDAEYTPAPAELEQTSGSSSGKPSLGDS